MKACRVRINRIISTEKGFTLAEALVAIIIMLLVSGIVVAGIPAAGSAYDNVVQVSSAEVTLSTAMSALRNELGLSKDITVEKDENGNDAASYYNEGFATRSMISKDDDNGIMYQRYAADEIIENKGGDAIRLVSEKTSGDNLIVTYDSVTHDSDNNVIVFNGLVVKKLSDGREMTKKRDLSIRVITE